MEYVKISDFTSVITGGTPSTQKKEYWANGIIPWLQSGCCQNCYVNSTSTYITKLGYDNSSTKLMPKDTIMIALTGATAGKVGYLNFEACGNQSITGILPTKSFKPLFLFYYLQYKRNDILHDCVGGAQPHISQGYVKNLLIPNYSIQKQEEISKVLESIKNVIDESKDEINKYDELISTQFNKMFGDTTIKEKTKLKYLTSKITDGSHNPPKGIGYSEYIMASSQNIFDVLDLSNVRYLTKEDFNIENKRTDVQNGDLLFTIVGTIGRSHIIKDEKIVLQRSVAVIKPLNTINSTYLKYFLSSSDGESQINKKMHGVAQMGLYLSDLKEIDIYVPNIDEQIAFEKFVNQIDKLKMLIQQRINLYQELLDKKMNEYFG